MRALVSTMYLTHYTNSVSAVTNILETGFAWMRNDRILIETLLPEETFLEREPQSFGQICFTENNYEFDRAGTKNFGAYGITVSKNWAHKHGAQPVIYISNEGPVSDTFQKLFQQFYQKAKVEELYPDDTARQQWMVNKAMANVVGQPIYALLLSLYEYMEPAVHSKEREWRIVNPSPDYGISKDSKEALKNVTPPRGWAKIIHVLPIESADIEAIHCPKQQCEKLRESIPAKYEQVAIHGH